MLKKVLLWMRQRWQEPQGYREILQVALPLIIGMSSTTIMEFTDRVFLAHYSTAALAAAMPAAIVFMAIFSTLMGVAGYTTVLIAQYVGSQATHRVGSALWQGVWFAAFSGVIMFFLSYTAEAIFSFAGHPLEIQGLEVVYFSMLCQGGFLGILNVVMDSFFSGRGKTRPVLVANLIATLVKIPIDYILIFGTAHISWLAFLGIPSMGIVGAGIGTYFAWLTSLVILGWQVFLKEHEVLYHVRSSWKLSKDMFKRLLRFGLPSGLNFFMEIIAITWFTLEVGTLGTVALAASNIAFSLNSLIFLPMLGMNFAVSSLVGQSMGRGKPEEVKILARNSLQLSLAYMLPLVAIIMLGAGELVDLFSARDINNADITSIKDISIILLYFIAVYSTLDAATIVYLGVLKGAGDTVGILYLLVLSFIGFLIIPIMTMKVLGAITLYRYWMAFTVYCIFITFGAVYRFHQEKWRHIQVVETAFVEQ